MATSALGDGGSDASSGTLVTYGQQEFGNAADTGPDGGCFDHFGSGHSWWALPVATGDHITIDLEGHTDGDGLYARVYPIGTNKFNVSDTDSYTEDDGDTFELKFTAPHTGTMPMDISTCDQLGAFDFTAYVTHVLVASIPKISSLSQKGTMHVAVHTPDGTNPPEPAPDASLQMSLHGKDPWTKVGKAHVSGAGAVIKYKIPSKLRNHHVKLRASAYGPGYATAYTKTQTVRTH